MVRASKEINDEALNVKQMEKKMYLLIPDFDKRYT